MSTAFICLLYSQPQLITASVVNKYEQSAKKDNKGTSKSCRVKEEEISILHTQTDSWGKMADKNTKENLQSFFSDLYTKRLQKVRGKCFKKFVLFAVFELLLEKHGFQPKGAVLNAKKRERERG